jgi:hypothetical protein
VMKILDCVAGGWIDGNFRGRSRNAESALLDNWFRLAAL